MAASGNGVRVRAPPAAGSNHQWIARMPDGQEARSLRQCSENFRPLSGRGAKSFERKLFSRILGFHLHT